MKKRITIISLTIVSLAILSVTFFWFYTGKAAHGIDDEMAWDGETISSTFSGGNGTKENPYQIKNGADIALLKQLIDGENGESYNKLYYVLDDNINLGSHEIEPIGIKNPFSGNLDGKGHTIKNISIKKKEISEEESKTYYYGLFGIVENANIKNLNIDTINIFVEKELTINLGTLAGKINNTNIENEESNEISNISINNINIDLSEIEITEEDNIGILSGSISNKYNVFNINITGSFKSKDNTINKLYNTNNSSTKNVVYSLENDLKIQNKEDKIENLYCFKNNKYYKDDKEIKLFDLLETLNKQIEEVYNWIQEGEKLKIADKTKEPEKKVEIGIGTGIERIIRSAPIASHASGTEGNTVYINDFDSDRNYLKGLNYTEVRKTSLPINNSGYYDDINLVKVQIIYDGEDINNNSIVGSMSPIEGESNLNRFVYYKYYGLERDSNGNLLTDINGHNYIHIELIDNPFSKRPYVNNKEYGFNGWVCNQDNNSSDNLCDNSTIGFKKSNYTRYMDIPVTGESEILVHLNASWVEANVETNANNIDNFKQMSMQSTSEISYYTTEYIQGRVYWKQNYTIMEYSTTYGYFDGNMPRGTWYKTNQNGATYTYNNRNRRCPWNNTCYIYTANTNGIIGNTEYTGGSINFVPNFNSSGNNTEITINSYNNNYMNFVADSNGNYIDTIQVPHYTSTLSIGENSTGLFYQVSNPTTSMINTKEYYKNDGTLCTEASDCTTAYKLIRYNDTTLNSQGHSISIIEENNGEMVDAIKYYYLVTRDTNIFRYVNSTSLTISNISVDRPFTVTGTRVNDNNPTGVLNLSNSLTVRNDLVIENILFYGPNSSGYSNYSIGDEPSSYSIYANSNNFKIGRNVSSSRDNNYLIANRIYAGNNYGNTGTFRIIIEQGNYYSYRCGADSGSNTSTFNETTILGNDYDRIKINNSKLVFLIGLDGYSNSGTNIAGSDNIFASFTTLKSGTYGFNTNGTANTDGTTGLYIGGWNSKNVESPTGVKIEGGKINIVLGGYGYNGNSTTNSSYIGMSGGEVRQIYGGAGHSTTQGNRIINVTGGKVNYSILGGSDSYSSSDTNDGIVQGSSVIYVGGNVIIGDQTNSLYGVESGSVFGAGGGNTSSTSKGTVYNSHVIINGGTVNGSVYGGGNYGSTGTQNNATSNSTVEVLSGIIKDSVFGGSKSAGFSKSNYSSSSVINVNIYGGTIKDVYGGSDEKGIIYGSVNVNINAGIITGDVYGGGRGSSTFVDSNVNVVIGSDIENHPNISGSVYGGSAYGTVNGSSTNGTAHGNTNVTINNGIITGNVFGGAKGSATETPYVLGNITVTVSNGSIGKVFGGFDASGSPKAGDTVYLNGGTIGDAFGGGNNASQTVTDIRLQGSSLTGNLYGGSNLSGTVNQSNVIVSSGTVTNVFGGNNMDGETTTTNITISGGTFNGDVYGGGNQADTSTTNVTINSGVLNDVYGGGYSAGVSNSTNIIVNNGTIDELFGGSNTSGDVGDTNIQVSNTYADRQNEPKVDLNLDITNNGEAWTDHSKNYITIKPTVVNMSDYNYTEWTARLIISGSRLFDNRDYLNSDVIDVDDTYTFTHINRYDPAMPFIIPNNDQYTIPGSFDVLVPKDTDYDVVYTITATDTRGITTTYKGSYTNETKNINLNKGINHIYGGNNLGGTTSTSTINISNGTIGEVYGGGNKVGITSTDINATGGNILSVYGGSNKLGNVATSNVVIGNTTAGPTLETVYGGNNLGGKTTSTNIEINKGTITDIYGGGNRAISGETNVIVNGGTINNIYGGGNEAAVENNTTVDIQNATILNNIYGGGDQGEVNGNTIVTFTDSQVNGSLYAGGNEAAVLGNTTVTVDGNSIIGTASTHTPNGSIFGSGNSASTGQFSSTKIATVNIVGGTVYGNVYGGANTSVVYGTTHVNIGTSAVDISGLKESDINIKGTVFGGGESNAAGSPDYDWTAISVTEGINIDINGEGYISNNHIFEIHGSIFGSGNASSSSGDSIINIKKLGSIDHPSENISIQRGTFVTIDESVIHLKGAMDKTNEFDDALYSFNIIGFTDSLGNSKGGLTIKNNTILLMDENSNKVVSFKSAVDIGGEEKLAEVNIDDDTKTVTKNVDNRIYLLANKKLNIAKNAQGTEDGTVKGMTFFGVYRNSRDNLSDAGLYGLNFDYGDSATAAEIVIASSYVRGAHVANHDITKDGFYTNILDEKTNFSEIQTEYINPTPNNTTYYRWLIGTDSISYEFTMTASKYQSMGTYTLSMDDFPNGDTTFHVLSFDESELDESLTLVKSNRVPKFARIGTSEENLFGLAMKSESTEWTSYNRTDYLSANNGSYEGDDLYLTSSDTGAPNLMFYLYYAKNIEKQGELGKVVIQMQSSTPKNGYESDIKFITITINIKARDWTDGNNYDASITYGKKYSMPVTTPVNITAKSQFTEYYSLIATEELEMLYGVNYENYHTLVSNYALPVGTTITMIDTSGDLPKYYYYEVNSTNYSQKLSQLATDNEITYKLSDFISMDSTTTTNKYNDATANRSYYYDEYQTALEEFLFIFDFKDANITSNVIGSEMLFEIRNAEDRTVVAVVAKKQEDHDLSFNIFDASNIVLEQIITNNNNNFHYDIPNTSNYRTNVTYSVNESSLKVVDTNYESSSMGVNIQLFNSEDTAVGANLLAGTKIRLNNKDYLVDSDGIFRIKLADKVTNISRDFSMTVDSFLPVGEYSMVFTIIASSDGLHSSSPNKTTYTLPIVVTGSDNSILVEATDKERLYYKEKGKNEAGTNTTTFNINYSSVLRNPNVRLLVSKRDTTSSSSRAYIDIPINNLFTETFTSAGNSSLPNEVKINTNTTTTTLQLTLNPNALTGTYKLSFKLYDGNVEVDSDETYIIVKKYIDDE